MLADEMGMGKSLSILSLVLRTLDDARQWAFPQDHLDVPGESPRRLSSATLIIVPSAREYLNPRALVIFQ